MIGLESSMLVCGCLGALHLIGLLSAAVARVSEGSCCQASGQRLFLLCLGLVGAVTLVSVSLGPGCWIASGTTLSLMVLGATCDFSRSRRVSSLL